MSRTVHCVKLGKDAPGLNQQPYPGELGKKIFESISEEAWRLWLRHQTMLINEHRLSVIDPKHRAFLEEQMHKFLFEDSVEIPQGYVPPDNK